MAKKDLKLNRKAAEDIMDAPEKEFKGYTLDDIRFQRALVTLEAELCKAKILKSVENIQQMNPLSPGYKSSSKMGKAGSIAMKMISGLNYLDYIMLGFSVFSGARKVYSFFHKKKN